jgi:predicted ester cyclase
MRKDITMSAKLQDMSPSHQQKMAKHNKNMVYRYYREVWNHGNLSVINQVFAANHIAHHAINQFDTPLTGRQGIRQLVTAFRAALPDLILTVEDMVGQWNKVAVRFTIQGTHQGELVGFAPTGKPVTLSGMMLHHIAKKKFTDTWISHDFVSTLGPVGTIPTAT